MRPQYEIPLQSKPFHAAAAVAPPMGMPVTTVVPYPSDPMEVLQNLKGAWISQKAQYLETLGPCEIENTYNIFVKFLQNLFLEFV